LCLISTGSADRGADGTPTVVIASMAPAGGTTRRGDTSAAPDHRRYRPHQPEGCSPVTPDPGGAQHADGIGDTMMTEQTSTGATTGGASFSVHVDPPWLLHLVGELDLASAPTLERALEGPIELGGVIGLDVAELTFMDSTGIKALAHASRLLGERGRVVLFQPTGAVRRVIEICGLHEMFDLDDAPAALKDTSSR